MTLKKYAFNLFFNKHHTLHKKKLILGSVSYSISYQHAQSQLWAFLLSETLRQFNPLLADSKWSTGSHTCDKQQGFCMKVIAQWLENTKQQK